MKWFNRLSISTLSLLMACSTFHSNHETPKATASRYVANVDEIGDLDASISQKKVEKLIKGIFHAYLLGQVKLKEFDEVLDRTPEKAMDSRVYGELLSIRSMVDEYEEQMSKLYVELVLIRALPRFDEVQKANAKLALDTIGQFLEGAITNHEVLDENLKPLILNNLMEKQDDLYSEFLALRSNPEITKGDPQVEKILTEYAAKVRLTNRHYRNDLKNYKVDEAALDKALSRVEDDRDFKHFKHTVKKSSKQMRKLMKQVKNGRSTSADAIFPSAGANGNITGNGYPANTWSITYDDGPGGKTSPTVLKNLQDRKLRATFFQLAKQVEALPNTAKSIWDANMDIACHSYDHAQLTKLSGAALDKQITVATKIISDKYGKKLKLFRLPYGAGVSVTPIRTKIAENDLIHVFWNVDTLDWQDKNPQSILDRAVKQMKATKKMAGIVLFHDIHPQSVIASTMLMDYMIKEKIVVCPVQSVIDQLNQGLPSCQP